MSVISSIAIATIRMAVPLILLAIAELYSEKAGMVNIGLEGLAAIGALFGFMITYYTGNSWAGILCGAVAGVAVNMIYAYATISLCANHIVYGMAVNIFAPALASFLYRMSFGTGNSLTQIALMNDFKVPGFSQIPILGKLLFQSRPVVYLTIFLVLFTYIYFAKTKSGLNYSAVGEFPKAAATIGINVIRIKYISCVICGALAGIGGAYLTTCYSSTYTEGIVSGRGFIALAAVIFGRWNGIGVLLACLFFGLCDAIQIRLQVGSSGLPYQFFQMIPYLATVVVLAIIGSSKAGSKANGVAYRKEQR